MRRVIQITAIIIVLFLVPVGYAVAYETLSIVLPPLLWLGAGLVAIILILGFIGGLLGGFTLGREMVRTRLAQLRGQQVIAEAEAHIAMIQAKQKEVFVVTAPPGHQFAVRDDDPKSEYRLLHLPWTRVNGKVLAPTAAELEAYNAFHGNRPQLARPEPLMIDAPAEPDERPLLPAIRHADNILVVGGKGTGKTSLLQWIEAERMGSQEIVIMDSHAEPAQWQGRMVGLGRDYEAILQEMQLSLKELDQRYKRRLRGDKSYQATTAIIDEFTLLPIAMKDNFDFDIKSYSRPLLTEGRKVKMNCIWGIHSDRAEALGLQGAMDLKECFDVIVYLKNVKEHHYAICDFGEGKEDIRYAHPGPFISPVRVEVKPPTRPKPTAEEKVILRAWWAMKDQEKIVATELHWVIRPDLTSKPSKGQLDKYRDVIKKFGYDPKF